MAGSIILAAFFFGKLLRTAPYLVVGAQGGRTEGECSSARQDMSTADVWRAQTLPYHPAREHAPIVAPDAMKVWHHVLQSPFLVCICTV